MKFKKVISLFLIVLMLFTGYGQSATAMENDNSSDYQEFEHIKQFGDYQKATYSDRYYVALLDDSLIYKSDSVYSRDTITLYRYYFSDKKTVKIVTIPNCYYKFGMGDVCLLDNKLYFYYMSDENEDNSEKLNYAKGKLACVDLTTNKCSITYIFDTIWIDDRIIVFNNEILTTRDNIIKKNKYDENIVIDEPIAYNPKTNIKYNVLDYIDNTNLVASSACVGNHGYLYFIEQSSNQNNLKVRMYDKSYKLIKILDASEMMSKFNEVKPNTLFVLDNYVFMNSGYETVIGKIKDNKIVPIFNENKQWERLIQIENVYNPFEIIFYDYTNNILYQFNKEKETMEPLTINVPKKFELSSVKSNKDNYLITMVDKVNHKFLYYVPKNILSKATFKIPSNAVLTKEQRKQYDEYRKVLREKYGIPVVQTA